MRSTQEVRDQYETAEKARKYEIFKKNKFIELIDNYSARMYLGDLTGKSVIDFACGTGHSSRLLADLNAERVVGVDLSSAMVDYAKQISNEKQAYSRIEYAVKDCGLQMQELGLFDVVFSSHFVNYAETEERLANFASAMYSSLKEKGICIGMTVNCFTDPVHFPKYHKYGFDMMRHSNRRTDTAKLYDGDVQKGKLLFQFENTHWEPEVYEDAYSKAGFKDFKWMNPLLDPSYVDTENFFEDFFQYPPFVFFHATK